MSNLVSVFDSMFSDFVPRVHRRPWVLQRYCDTDNCTIPHGLQVHKGDDEYTFDLDLPGVDKDDLVTELDKDILTIYTKSDESEKDGSDDVESLKDHPRKAKRMYRFQFRVPDDIDATRLTARLKNGVLSITLPKSEEKKPIKVPVNIE